MSAVEVRAERHVRLKERLIQSFVGMVIGSGMGVLLGFVKLALYEELYPSGGFGILAPSGPLAVGILGAILLGLAGGVVGLITGAFVPHTFRGAALGALIFPLVRWRAIYEIIVSTATAIQHYLHEGYLDRRLIFGNILLLSLFLDCAIIGLLVAVLLRRLFVR